MKRSAGFFDNDTIRETTMLLKGCLHTHTTCSDGKMTPQEVADAYQSLGYDFIAFTDHDYLLGPRCEEIYGNVKSDLIIFRGIELTVFAKGYVHVNRIEGDNETLYVFNHLGEYDLTVEEVQDRISIVREKYPIDMVEITTKGFRHKEFEIPEIEYPKMASDDSHSRVGIGRAWVELDADRDRDHIIKKMKQGDFWNCYV